MENPTFLERGVSKFLRPYFSPDFWPAFWAAFDNISLRGFDQVLHQAFDQSLTVYSAAPYCAVSVCMSVCLAVLASVLLILALLLHTVHGASSPRLQHRIASRRDKTESLRFSRFADRQWIFYGPAIREWQETMKGNLKCSAATPVLRKVGESSRFFTSVRKSLFEAGLTVR